MLPSRSSAVIGWERMDQFKGRFVQARLGSTPRWARLDRHSMGID